MILDNYLEIVAITLAAQADLTATAAISVLDDVRAGLIYGELDIEDGPLAGPGLLSRLADELADGGQVL
jgi:hypothetical protein